MKNLVYLIKETFAEWSEDKASRLAAALAYYTSFSLAPILVLIIGIAGLVLGNSTAVHDLIMTQVGDLLGDEGALFISSMIKNASKPSTGVIATIVGVVTLLFGALGVFGELQNALNTIWEVQLKPITGLANNIKHYLVKRVLSFAMLMVILFLLLVSLVISAALSAFGDFMDNAFAISEIVMQMFNFLFSFGLITLLFALIFKYLPDAKIRWRDVWLGAGVTSLLFTLGKFAIGLYLGKSEVSTTFGAAGSLALLLIWVYYSSQIIFLGAEFTQVYANTFGTPIEPDEDAVKLTEVERRQLGMERKRESEVTPHMDVPKDTEVRLR